MYVLVSCITKMFDATSCKHYECFRHFVGARSVAVFPPVCLEAGKQYRIRLEFKAYESEVETPTASVLVDSVSCSDHSDLAVFQVEFFYNNVLCAIFH